MCMCVCGGVGEVKGCNQSLLVKEPSTRLRTFWSSNFNSKIAERRSSEGNKSSVTEVMYIQQEELPAASSMRIYQKGHDGTSTNMT